MTHVLVAVPARDEEQRVGACLQGVGAALRRARDAGAATRVALAVGVHRSNDGTAAEVASHLADLRDVEVYSHVDEVSASVGEARHRLAQGAMRALGLQADATTWLFSTDADSVVPSDWVTGMLAQTRHAGAAGAAGLVRLEGWHAPPAAAAAYEQILRAGLTEDGHRHVYGANLVVRMDAYAGAGGFPPLPHGEDHELVARVRGRGHRVVAVIEPVVRTSSRMPGRARHGLGDLLEALAGGAHPRMPGAGDAGRACCAG